MKNAEFNFYSFDTVLYWHMLWDTLQPLFNINTWS